MMPDLGAKATAYKRWLAQCLTWELKSMYMRGELSDAWHELHHVRQVK